jgi:hypothetical protein
MSQLLSTAETYYKVVMDSIARLMKRDKIPNPESTNGILRDKLVASDNKNPIDGYDNRAKMATATKATSGVKHLQMRRNEEPRKINRRSVRDTTYGAESDSVAMLPEILSSAPPCVEPVFDSATARRLDRKIH